MQFDIHHHWPEQKGVNRRLDEILDRLDLLEERIWQLMALSKESKDLVKKLDTATSAIAARLKALLDKPNTTEAEFRAELAPLATALEAMGKDPQDPIPDLPTP